MLNKLIILYMILSNAQHEIAQSMNVFGENQNYAVITPKLVSTEMDFVYGKF